MARSHRGLPMPKDDPLPHAVLTHLNKGGLHRALGVPPGQKIPAEKMEQALHSKDEHVRRMALFARTLEGFHHGGKR